MSSKNSIPELESYGICEIQPWTCAGTYASPEKKAAAFFADQADNRSSASWKKAEFIVLTDLSNHSLEEILSKWVYILRKDPDAPHNIQKLLIKSDDAIWSLYDHNANLLGKGELQNIMTQYQSSQKNKKNCLPLGNKPHQKIFYGAPGSGKSWKTNEVVKVYSDTIRTTFHPESDYSTFVGCYKPKMVKVTKYGLQGQPITVDGRDLQEEVVTYKFVAQAFTKAYVQAWEKYANKDNGVLEPQFLVIEEINRGNCAQIFGDLFQLLDRKNGFSEYPIEADADLMDYLSEEFSKRINDVELPGVERFDEIKAGKILVLPPNFYIWATMNTSDQSLFPMDSAFKRRWDWEYVPIKRSDKASYTIGVNDVNGTPYDWWTFLLKINKRIFEATQSEDKKLGYFFAKPREGTTIEADVFVNKVLFYLYNDVFKDDGLPDVAIGDAAEGKVGFAAFFTDEGEIDEANVAKFLEVIVGTPEKATEEK